MKNGSLAAAVAALVVLTAAPFARAQSPLQQQGPHYMVTISRELRIGGYALPPGSYELFQASATDPNLFTLSAMGSVNAPLAFIRTTRVASRDVNPSDGRTTFRLDIDDSVATVAPVVRGWIAPGENGWEIVSVDGKDPRLRKLE